MEDTTPFLVCKICECQISTAIFQNHIKSCKDLAELKQKVLHYQSKLSTHVNRAYDLRNQLNTNFAIEKKKHERRNSRPDRSPSPIPDRIKSVHIHREFLFDKELLNDDLSPASANKKMSKPFLTINTGLGKKLQEYEDQMCKTLNVLKVITQYGHNNLSDPAEVNIDLITDLKVRNEVNLMYLEIKDKQISEYIEKFIKIIQKLIKDKQAYIKKQEESQKIMCRTVDTLQIPLVNIPNIVSPRPGRLLSLDDGDVSDLSSERKKRKSVFNPPTTIWIRRASVGNPGFQSKLVLGTPTDDKGEDDNRRGNRVLSKFASPMLAKHNSAVDSPITTAKLTINKFEKGVMIKGRIPIELKEAMLNISQVTFRFEDRLKKVQEMPKRNSKKSRDESPTSVGLSHRKVQIKRNVTVYMDKLERKTPKRQSDLVGWGGENENNNSGGDGKKKKKKFQKILSLDQILQNKKPQEDTLVVVSKTAKKLPSQENEEKALSKGQLTPSCSASSSYTHSMASIPEKEDHQENQTEENHQEFPVLTNRGYYSDSEINDMKSTTEQSQRKFEVTIEDFQFIKFLGEGAFGKVYLVKKRKTGDIYAMKIVDSADREATHNKIASLRAERDAYKSIKGHWVVKAFYTLSYQSYVCFVIEYMIGGDLEGLLEQVGCFDESYARFYFAELVLAVESLHNVGLIHRDLKPDNVLIDSTGHIKLTDFGLSEQGLVKVRNQSSTFQMLSRGNSLIDSNALGLSAGFGMFPITEKKDSVLTQKEGECVSQELNSGGEPLNSPESMQFPDSISLKKEVSAHSERFSPVGDEPYIIKNKKDEEVVFSCLVGEEQRLGWMKKTRLGASNVSANSKKKEVHRIVGTPDYMAPEIIKGEDCNDQAVDLWSLGVILYELLAGVPPFNDESIDRIFGNIMQGKMEWPPIGYGDDCMTPEAEDLIKKLMNPDPKQRISIKDLKQHAFFKGFDWKNVKEMKAPFIPKKKEIDPNSALDTNNIFKIDNSKLVKQASILNEMPTFNTKRIDLLYQLNQTLYNNHLKDVESQSKEI